MGALKAAGEIVGDLFSPDIGQRTTGEITLFQAVGKVLEDLPAAAFAYSRRTAPEPAQVS
jgi:ornithine cyclodeaminase/alanine dehydrogenase-like protein (mu-crystallin family)